MKELLTKLGNSILNSVKHSDKDHLRNIHFSEVQEIFDELEYMINNDGTFSLEKYDRVCNLISISNVEMTANIYIALDYINTEIQNTLKF